jgi:competence protein ComEC
LNAVTISAQIFTLPIVIYQFHQFPNMFLFSNLIAVPLSSIVLYAELLLLLFSPIDSIASVIGNGVSLLIKALNDFISYMNSFAYATTDQIHMGFGTALLLFIFIALLSASLLNRSKKLLLYSLFTLLLVVSLNSLKKRESALQSKLIVYNINKHAAAEILIGDKAYFSGDKEVLKRPALYNFHIKPSHVAFNISKIIGQLHSSFHAGNMQIVKGTEYPAEMPDVFIISGNPKVNSIHIIPTNCILVADNTNARWKINRWKKQADSLHLRFHSIPDDGAFVMDL